MLGNQSGDSLLEKKRQSTYFQCFKGATDSIAIWMLLAQTRDEKIVNKARMMYIFVVRYTLFLMAVSTLRL